MKHRFVAVLLERKREELGESLAVFGKRLYPESDSQFAGSTYCSVACQSAEISECRLPIAAEILGVPFETLRTI